MAELPRSALIARFGDEGARLHARARGEETEPFRARRAPERLALALPIEPPVEDLEPLRFVAAPAGGGAHRPAHRPGTRRGPRARWPSSWTWPSRATGTPPRIEVEQRFPEPTADPEAVERLLFARLEREPPPAAVQRLDLELRGTTPAAGQQLPLFVPQAARTARLGWQLARLALTYGEDRVRRVAITDPEAPLPEDRWTWQGVGPRRRRCGPGDAGCCASTRASTSSSTPTAASPPSAGTAGARRSRSAIDGGSRRRGGATRSPATTSRSSGSAGSPSSTSTASPGRGTSSACTTEPSGLAAAPMRPRCVSWNGVGSFSP